MIEGIVIAGLVVLIVISMAFNIAQWDFIKDQDAAINRLRERNRELEKEKKSLLYEGGKDLSVWLSIHGIIGEHLVAKKGEADVRSN